MANEQDPLTPRSTPKIRNIRSPSRYSQKIDIQRIIRQRKEMNIYMHSLFIFRDEGKVNGLPLMLKVTSQKGMNSVT